MERRGAFDYILLETTGLADPGNIAPLFWVDDGLGSSIYLDGIVTVVDAKNILRSLEEGFSSEDDRSKTSNSSKSARSIMETSSNPTTAHLQISHADVIVINKSDLVSVDQLDRIKQRVMGINGLAKIYVTHHSRIPHLEGVLLDLHAYDNVTALDMVDERNPSILDPVRTFLSSMLMTHFPSTSSLEDIFCIGSFNRILKPRIEQVPCDLHIGIKCHPSKSFFLFPDSTFTTAMFCAVLPLVPIHLLFHRAPI